MNHIVLNGERRKKTHGEFVAKMKELNPQIEVIGKYNGRREKVACRCSNCGYEWEPQPCNLYRDPGCPKCKINKRQRNGSKLIDRK